MTAKYDGCEISTGFLTGNFGDDIDAQATASKLRAAIETAFPGAEVTVRHQQGEGIRPYDLKTHCYRDGEPDYDLETAVEDCVAFCGGYAVYAE